MNIDIVRAVFERNGYSPNSKIAQVQFEQFLNTLMVSSILISAGVR
jgi:hypothetical protein